MCWTLSTAKARVSRSTSRGQRNRQSGAWTGSSNGVAGPAPFESTMAENTSAAPCRNGPGSTRSPSGTSNPGQPQQTADIARCNRTVRHEWSEQYITETIGEPKDHATHWFRTCNNHRPNIGLAGMTPAQKLKLAASVLRMHPLEKGGITDAPRLAPAAQPYPCALPCPCRLRRLGSRQLTRDLR